MRRTTTLVAGAAAALMVAAAPASASDIVGSDLTRTPDFGYNVGNIDAQRTAPTGSPVPVTAPASGVIVSLLIKHSGSGANPGALGFRIATGAGPAYTVRADPRLPDFPVAANLQPGFVTIIPKDAGGNPAGVVIAAGERLAQAQIGGTNGQTLQTFATFVALGARDDFIALALATPGAVWNTEINHETTWQYVVEADADGDGYGDETQECANRHVTIAGTRGNDVIVGTPGKDVIAAGGGDDLIRGLGGNDILCGGAGNDKLKGGAGNDKLYGNTGRDNLKGGAGQDACSGGPQHDTAKKCEQAKQI